MANGPHKECQANHHRWTTGPVTASQWDKNGKSQRRQCNRAGCTTVEINEKPPNRGWNGWRRTN